MEINYFLTKYKNINISHLDTGIFPTNKKITVFELFLTMENLNDKKFNSYYQKLTTITLYDFYCSYLFKEQTKYNNYNKLECPEIYKNIKISPYDTIYILNDLAHTNEKLIRLFSKIDFIYKQNMSELIVYSDKESDNINKYSVEKYILTNYVIGIKLKTIINNYKNYLNTDDLIDYLSINTNNINSKEISKVILDFDFIFDNSNFVDSLFKKYLKKEGLR